MGRKRTSHAHLNLPKYMHVIRNKNGSARYYYGKEAIPLGSDLETAIRISEEMNLLSRSKEQIERTTGCELLSLAGIVGRSFSWGGLCGVYFLFLQKQVVYVGQSINIFRRLGQHAEKGAIQFDAVSWIECGREELGRLERAYIHLFNPPLNKKVDGLIRAQPELQLAAVVEPQ